MSERTGLIAYRVITKHAPNHEDVICVGVPVSYGFISHLFNLEKGRFEDMFGKEVADNIGEQPRKVRLSMEFLPE